MYNKKEQQKAIEDLNRLAALYDMSVMHTFEPLEKAIIELISLTPFDGENFEEKHFTLYFSVDDNKLHLAFYYGVDTGKTIDLTQVIKEVSEMIESNKTEHAEIRADENRYPH